MEEKQCRVCGETKPLDAYSSWMRGEKVATSSYCKPCARERSRRWSNANPERRRAQNARRTEQMRADPELRARVNARSRVLSKARRAAKSKVGQTFTAECKRCGETFEYVFNRKPRTVCDHCRKHDASWSTFRLTGKQAEQLRARGCCDICGGTRPGGRFNNWHIDHDHETGVVRGVLCAACNTAIGLLGEDPERIIAAAEYVATHQALSA